MSEPEQANEATEGQSRLTAELGLKPCPFCGEIPELSKHFRDEIWQLIHRCKVLGPIVIEWGDARRITKQWNTRTPTMRGRRLRRSRSINLLGTGPERMMMEVDDMCDDEEDREATNLTIPGFLRNQQNLADEKAADERWKVPPCLECGAETPEQGETMCNCAGDKDHCHGCELWPD